MSIEPAATDTSAPVRGLLERSNRLGADPRNTNYAGGNTSAKGIGIDPVDRRAGRAAVGQGLRRRPRHADRGRSRGPAARPPALARRRLPGRRTRGRDGRRVRLLPPRPRRRRALDRHRDARARRGRTMSTTSTRTRGSRWRRRPTARTLTRRCFGDRVAWVDWRRPGFQLGLDMAEVRRANPEAIGVILGGHGITAWGDTSAECEARSLEIIRTAERFIADNGRAEPFGAADRRATSRCPRPSATPGRPPCCRSSAGWPRPTGRRSATTPTARSSSTSSAGRSTRGWPRWAPRARTISCGPRCGRWSSTCRRPPSSTTVVARLRELHEAYRDGRTRAYYERHATAGQPGDARRGPGHRPRPGRRHVLVRGEQADGPGRRRVLRQRDQRHARRRGAVDLCARSTRSEKFRIEYWALEEAKLAADAQAEAAGRPGRAS